jgi:hypothetical protein
MKALGLAAVAACIGCGTRAAAPLPGGVCAAASAWQSGLRSLPAGTLLGVDAGYVRDTCSGTAQVSATILVLRRPGAASAGALSRLLECPSLEILVSETPEGVLPPGLVQIDVKHYAGDFMVTLRADSVAKNILLLHRARMLAVSNAGRGAHSR